MPESTCPHCGDPLPERSGGGRPRKFCTDKCTRDFWSASHPGKHVPDAGPHTCVCCGETWTGRKRKYCCVDCAQQARRRIKPPRSCDECGQPVQRKGRFAVCSSCAAERKRRGAKRPLQICPVCQRNFMPKSNHAEVCSRDCVHVRLRWRRAARIVSKGLPVALPQGPPRPRQARMVVRKSYRRRRFIGGHCAECGEVFVATQATARYCSNVCATRDHRRRHKQIRSWRIRSRSRRDRISLPTLAERDSWKCHLCGGKVTRETWSVDHIVPLSQYGTHTWDNVALAHHRCNTIRNVQDLGTARTAIAGLVGG